jgi:hypothetical protein
VTRLAPDGSLDPSFGVGGRFSAVPDGGLPWWEETDIHAGGAREAGDDLLTPDGRVVVAGTPDATFGDGGRVVVLPGAATPVR